MKYQQSSGGVHGRSYSYSQYRYGFNRKELDIETNTLDYGFRIYNPSLGRFLSVDPLFKSYPWLSTYQFATNRPIVAIDIDGLESSDITAPIGGDPNEIQLDEGMDVMSEEEYSDYAIDPVEVKPPPIPWWKHTISFAADMCPIIGDIKGYAEVISGDDLITGEEMSTAARILSAVPILGKRIRTIGKYGGKLIKGIWRGSKEIIQKAAKKGKYSDDLAVVLKATGNWTGAMSKALGNAGESLLRKTYGGVSKTFGTKEGDRVVDAFVNGTAREGKVGRTGLTSRVETELKKDFEMLMSGDEVKNVEWIFYTSGRTGKGGYTDNLLNYVNKLNKDLEKAGKNTIKLIDRSTETVNLPTSP